MAIGSITWRPVTIANGEALSGALETIGKRMVAIYQAASTEGTAWGLQASHDGGTTYTALSVMIQEATGAAPVTAAWEVAKSATAAQIIFLPEAMRVYGPTHLKLQSQDGAGAATNQTGAQTVWVGLEDLPNPM